MKIFCDCFLVQGVFQKHAFFDKIVAEISADMCFNLCHL